MLVFKLIFPNPAALLLNATSAVPVKEMEKNNLKVAMRAMIWPTDLCCVYTLQTHFSPVNLSYLHELKGALGFKLHTGMLRFPDEHRWQMRSRQIHFMLPRATNESCQCPENGVSQYFQGG